MDHSAQVGGDERRQSIVNYSEKQSLCKRFFFFTLKQTRTVLAKWLCTWASSPVFATLKLHVCARTGLCSQRPLRSHYQHQRWQTSIAKRRRHRRCTKACIKTTRPRLRWFFFSGHYFSDEGLLFSFWRQPCSAVTSRTQWWCPWGFCSCSRPFQLCRTCR